MGKLTVTCLDWKPLRKGSLLGFAKICVVQLDLVIHDVPVHESHGRRWAQLPARAWIKDGALVFDDRGRIQYSPAFEFTRREVRDAFSQRVVEAVQSFAPNALALEAAT